MIQGSKRHFFTYASCCAILDARCGSIEDFGFNEYEVISFVQACTFLLYIHGCGEGEKHVLKNPCILL